MAFVFRAKRQLSLKENNSKVYLQPNKINYKPNIYAFNSTLKKKICNKDKKKENEQNMQIIEYEQKEKERQNILEQIELLNNMNKQSLFGQQERFQKLNTLNEVSYDFDKEKVKEFQKRKKEFQQKQFKYKNNHDKYYAQIPAIQKVQKVKSVLDDKLQQYEEKKRQILDDMKNKPINGIDWKNTTKKTISLKRNQNLDIDTHDLNKKSQKIIKQRMNKQGKLYLPTRYRKRKQLKDNDFKQDFETEEFYNNMKQYINKEKNQQFQYQFFSSSVPRFQQQDEFEHLGPGCYLRNQQQDKVNTYNTKKDFQFGQQEERFNNVQNKYKSNFYLPHQSFIKPSFNKSNIFIIKDAKFKQKKQRKIKKPEIEQENEKIILKQTKSIKKIIPKKTKRQILSIKKNNSVSQMNVQNLNISYKLKEIEKQITNLNDINKKVSFGSQNDRFDLKKYQKKLLQKQKLGQIKIQKELQDSIKSHNNQKESFTQSQRFQYYKDISNQRTYDIPQKWQKQSYNVLFNANQLN